jgi:hypothetical protein
LHSNPAVTIPATTCPQPRTWGLYRDART